jgi:glycosyltransferase involved in cell wall biosynthesis
MKILWICGLPFDVQNTLLGGKPHGARAPWSWILGHLPPPDGVELHIACPVTAGPWLGRTLDYMGATIHLVRLPPGRLQSGFLFDPLFFLRVYRKVRPDVVHGWGTEDSFSTTAKFLSPRRHVVQVQGLINAYLPHFPASKSLRYVAFRERGNLKTAKNVFVESGFSREISEPHCGRKTRIFVVDHPLRPDFLTAGISKSLPKEVLFLGSITERKGFLDALRAFANGAPADWKLTMVGPGAKSDFDILASEIENLGLSGRCRHVVKLDTPEIIEHMRKASVFLLPTRMDTGPTALKEALAMGLWPVCYDNSGPREYIRRFEYGSVAKDGNPEDLTRVLAADFDTRPWENKNRRRRVVDRVRHELGKECIWNQLLQHYGTIIDENPA